MIQEVKQWIDEIQILQQKLTEAVQEREEAFASAAKWRSLYETEAKQRRIEAKLARQNANALKAKIQQLQELPIAGFESNDLAQALRAEQAKHTQTRYALTTALGDTIENLTQQRAARHKHEQAEVQRQTVVITHETVQSSAKTPLLALPPTNSAQSQS